MVKKHLATKITHASNDVELTLGAVNPVVQRASSFVFANYAAKQQIEQHPTKRSISYGRHGTTTHFALTEALCEIEQAAGCALYPSGLAAITNSILAFVGSGDHILIADSVYSPTQDFCRHILPKMGINFDFFDPNQPQQIANLIHENTKVIFLESPASVTLEFYDAPAIVRHAKSINPNIVAIIDNTWAAGVLFKPLNHGFDVSVQSGTKYIIGHSDYMLGIAVANEACYAQLKHWYKLTGQSLDAETAYMALRGLRTMITRLEQHYRNSSAVANWLIQQPQVAMVNHPAIANSAGQQIWQRDFTGGNGLLFFALQKRLTQQQLVNFVDNLHYFGLAYSWGGFESLILPYQTEDIQKIRPVSKVAITGTMFRVHIGLEQAEDLIADLASQLTVASSQ